MPMSIRTTKLMALANPPPAPMVQTYYILDPHHLPDLKGEFAGQRVFWTNGQQAVKLTPRQAQFYLDQGVLVLAPPVDPVPMLAKPA